MELSPILLFTYNRLSHTRMVIAALLQNEYASVSDLIVYSDGSKEEKTIHEVESVRHYLKSITGFKSVTIFERPQNWGLANNIIDGVTSVVNEYGKVIVLEDDLVVSPYFLKYMNEALEFYEKEEQVVSIHGYVYPVKDKLPETFFLKCADCWGWATWKRGWDLFNSNGSDLLKEIESRCLKKEFDFNNSYPFYQMLQKQISGQNNSWAIRWYASTFLSNKLSLYPQSSLVKQIGTDGSGTHHHSYTDVYDVSLAQKPIKIERIEIKESVLARRVFIRYYRYISTIGKLKSFLKRVFNIK